MRQGRLDCAFIAIARAAACGETQREGRARAGCARDFDLAAMSFDDAVTDRQPKPGAVRPLRRKKRLEDARLQVGRDAYARVCDLDEELLVRLPLAAFDRAALRHRFERVQDQVDED